MPDNFWEKALVLGAFALAACFMLLLAKRELLDTHNATPTSQSVAAASELDAESQGSFSDVAGAERSASGSETRVPSQKRVRDVKPTPVHVEREDCAALKHVHDRTRGERAWYIDNCLFVSKKNGASVQAPKHGWQPADIEAQLQAAGFSLDQPTPRRAAGNAGATPPPDLTSAVAVSKAVDWIPDNTPVMVSLGATDCTPVWLNGHWVVTCNVTLEGCALDYCVASLSVCVFATEPAVVPDLYC